jgi:hypothetical protein
MITLDEIKYFLNITSTAHDEFLLSLIDMTTARINNLCGRNTNYSSNYDIRSGNGDTVFALKNYPVEKIESILIRENTGSFDKDLFGGEPPEDNIFLEKETGKVILLNGFMLPAGESNVRIKYFAGYTQNAPDPVNELPNDLKWIALLMTAESFLKSFQPGSDGTFTKRAGLSRLDIENTDNTRYSFIYKDEDFETILWKYKNYKF